METQVLITVTHPDDVSSKSLLLQSVGQISDAIGGNLVEGWGITMSSPSESAPLTYATTVTYPMEHIDLRLQDLARQISQQLASVQEHSQRLTSDFGIGATIQREPHILAYQVQGSLETLGEKVRELAMLQEQHIALVLLRRELAYPL